MVPAAAMNAVGLVAPCNDAAVAHTRLVYFVNPAVEDRQMVCDGLVCHFLPVTGFCERDQFELPCELRVKYDAARGREAQSWGRSGSLLTCTSAFKDLEELKPFAVF